MGVSVACRYEIFSHISFSLFLFYTHRDRDDDDDDTIPYLAIVSVS